MPSEFEISSPELISNSLTEMVDYNPIIIITQVENKIDKKIQST